MGGDHIEFKDRLTCLDKLGHFFGIPRAPFLLSWCRDECAFEILLRWITTMKSRWWTDCLLDRHFNPCKRKRQGHGRHRNFQLNCKKKQFLHWAEIWRRNYHITIVIHASLKVGSHLAASIIPYDSHELLRIAASPPPLGRGLTGLDSLHGIFCQVGRFFFKVFLLFGVDFVDENWRKHLAN